MVRCMQNREVERQARRAVRKYEAMLTAQRAAIEATAQPAATRAAALEADFQHRHAMAHLVSPRWADTAKQWAWGQQPMIKVCTPEHTQWVEARPTPAVGTKRIHQDIVHELSVERAPAY